MAKGNLFLGTAARSVGDVVMYRREGSQVSRVRVRKIANPRTDAQSLQRAAFSPVAKFFSPLAVVLERAWEGVSKSKSYSEFLKENVKKARQNGWLLPKGTGFFPLPYQLTKGTLPSSGLMTNVDEGFFIIFNGTSGAITTIAQLSAAFVKNGYKAGDVVTIISANAHQSDDSFFPVTAQFEIDPKSTATIADTLNGFEFAIGDGTGHYTISNSKFDQIRGMAICVARFENDKWRRSTESLVVDLDFLHNYYEAHPKAEIIATYGNTAGSINPLVYLDGKDLEG